jgi:hypothetical protein
MGPDRGLRSVCTAAIMYLGEDIPMTRFARISFGVGVLLAGSAIVGATIATYPAAADGARLLLKPFGLTTCNTSSPCTEFKNNGVGPAIRGDGTRGEGVVAVSTSTFAIRGTTQSPSTRNPIAAGVNGVDQSNDGGHLNIGVNGFSLNGTGVEGTTQNSVVHNPPITAGVEGLSTSGSFSPGVLGQSSGVADGVEGDAFNPGGIGVAGVGEAGGVGVAGSTGGGPGIALFGTAVSGYALDAQNLPGDANPAAIIVGGTTNPANNSLITYDSASSATFWVDNGGNAHVRGLIFTSGPCSAGCARTKDSPAQQVQRYTLQEAVPTIEDVGEAQLSGGSAYVRIDPAFANVMDRRVTYLVFVTPQGLTRGLYVTNKTAQGFQVKEEPGDSTSVAFDYRIVAKPLGQGAPRLPMIATPLEPKAPSLLHERHDVRVRTSMPS